MKRVLALFLFTVHQLICVVCVSGQNTFSKHHTEISAGLNQIDRNVRLDHWVRLGRSGLRIGLKYSTWWYPVDDKSYLFKDRGYAQNFLEHLGIQVGYTYEWLRLKSGFSLYLFNDLQLSNTSIRIHNYHFLGKFYVPPFHSSASLFYLQDGIVPKVSIFELNTGLGLIYQLSKHFAINEMSGLGVAIARVNWNTNDLQTKKLSIGGIFPFLRFGICWKWISERK